MIIFSSFHTAINTLVFPEGRAEQRVPLFRNFVVNGLIQLQTYVESYQLVNVAFYDKDQSFDDCGLSIIQGCRGQIGAVYAFKPACRCQRYFYEPASLEKMSCLYENCRCGVTACCVCGTSPCSCRLFSAAAYQQDPLYCGDKITGNDGCKPPYLAAEPEDDCGFINADRYFAIGPDRRIWLWPRFPCGYILAVHWRGIRRSYLDTDYVHDDDDLKDAVACYVESEVARRVDKDQALADRLYADYRLKAGDIIFREERDLRPRATRICIEGLDQSELVGIYPDNNYPYGVGSSCAAPAMLGPGGGYFYGAGGGDGGGGDGGDGVVFQNTEQTFTAECPEGQFGEPVTVTIAAGTYTSTISQADANAKALAAATAQAVDQLECFAMLPDNACGNYQGQVVSGGTLEEWVYKIRGTPSGGSQQFNQVNTGLLGSQSPWENLTQEQLEAHISFAVNRILGDYLDEQYPGFTNEGIYGLMFCFIDAPGTGYVFTEDPVAVEDTNAPLTLFGFYWNLTVVFIKGT